MCCDEMVCAVGIKCAESGIEIATGVAETIFDCFGYALDLWRHILDAAVVDGDLSSFIQRSIPILALKAPIDVWSRLDRHPPRLIVADNVRRLFLEPIPRGFKQFAVQQASDGKTNSQWNLPSRGPSRELCVTVVGREEIHARHMSNEEYLIQLLNRTLEGNTGDRMLTVRRFNSGSVQLTHSDQVMVSATSDILVATHGAFETNVMYMPEGALLLEIRGEDGQFEREGDNFRGLAHTYMVHYRSVRARGLLSLRQKKYDLKRGEMQEIADIALDYVKYKVGS